MTDRGDHWRRNIARQISARHSAPARDVLGQATDWDPTCPVIGITGPPGAGKSSLIAALIEERLARDRRIAVVAIDPSSPRSGGSLLGDRIRMQGINASDELYIRSLPSGALQDGLCRNILGVLEVLSASDFDEIFLETIGVGQISEAIFSIVDLSILVMAPGMGDEIQAMKGGVLELADICVINKSDLPGSQRTAAEVESAQRAPSERNVSVVLTSAQNRGGVETLSQAIDLGLSPASPERRRDLASRRRHYGLCALVAQRLEELKRTPLPATAGSSLTDDYHVLIGRLSLAGDDR